jgi:DNA-binding transcriptional LysR family regulator
MDTLKEEVHGHLWIACSTTPGKYILPSLMAEFLKRHPKVNATISVTSRNTAMNWLNEGKAQIMLSSIYAYHNDIEFHKFISEPIVLIVPRNHPWAKRGSIELDELRKVNMIMREESSGTYSVVRDGLAQHGFDVGELRRVLTLGNSEAIAFAVQEGVGVGFVSMLVARRIVCDQVAAVKINGLELAQDIYLGQHRRLPSTPAQVAFWKMAIDEQSESKQKIKSLLTFPRGSGLEESAVV